MVSAAAVSAAVLSAVSWAVVSFPAFWPHPAATVMDSAIIIPNVTNFFFISSSLFFLVFLYIFLTMTTKADKANNIIKPAANIATILFIIFFTDGMHI